MPSANDGINAFEYARLYRESGWLGTIPIPNGKKHPPPTGFTGRAAPYPIDEQIDDWAANGFSNGDNHYEAPNSIALRLAEVVPEYVPKGARPVQYELIGIDIDDYREKNGFEQLTALQERLGALPPTLCSSSRWEAGATSYTAVFFVPAGYRYIGKAAKCIDVIQKAHRYTMVWPSTNPDAENALYRWRLANGSYCDGIPELDQVALLPAAWFDYLNIGIESDDPIADMTADELFEWATNTFHDINNMCTGMQSLLDKKLAELSDAADSHPNLTSAHWTLCQKAAEGHSGWYKAINAYSKAWKQHAMEQRDAAVPQAEISRSIIGALSKIQPQWELRGGILRIDTCANGDNVVDVSAWHYNLEESELIASLDNDGFGPVIGTLELGNTKEAHEYGRHDEGNAEHFLDLYTTQLKYIAERDGWVVWSNGRWHQDISDKYVRTAFRRVRLRQEQAAKQLMFEANGDKTLMGVAKAWSNWARTSGDISKMKSSLIAAHHYEICGESVQMRAGDFDRNEHLLGCNNGTLVLADVPYLKVPEKEDYVTYNTNIDYVPWTDFDSLHEADLIEQYQLWQEYLELFLPDPELREFVQRVLGHCLIGGNPDKLLIFICGRSNTGKTTLLGGLKGALGEYFDTVNRSLFLSKQFNPGLMAAIPRRIVGMNEVDGGALNAETIKLITGNSDVTAEVKNSNVPFTGRPHFTPIIACNYEPEIKNADEALTKRIMVIPFERQVVGKMVKYDRQMQIESDSGQAVLAWLVEGWKLYKQKGLARSTWPSEVRRISGEAVGNFNSTQMFISETFVKWHEDRDGKVALEMANRKAARKGRTMPNVTDWPTEWVVSVNAAWELYSNWVRMNHIPNPIQKPELGREIGLGRPQNKTVNGKPEKHYAGLRRKSIDE